jgi:hypothetical protein
MLASLLFLTIQENSVALALESPRGQGDISVKDLRPPVVTDMGASFAEFGLTPDSSQRERYVCACVRACGGAVTSMCLRSGVAASAAALGACLGAPRVGVCGRRAAAVCLRCRLGPAVTCICARACARAYAWVARSGRAPASRRGRSAGCAVAGGPIVRSIEGRTIAGIIAVRCRVAPPAA